MPGHEQRHLIRFEREDIVATPDSLTIIDGGKSNCYAIRRGESAFVNGPSLLTAKLLHSAVFRSLAVSDGVALWIDGGNSFDPFRITELAERCGYDARKLLSRIRIARAFTAHQMEAIARSAPKEVLGSRVSILVVSSIAELFTDDVKWNEGMDLLQSTIANLVKMTENCGIWSLMTSGVSVSSSAEMERIVNENFTRVISAELENDGLYMESDGTVVTVNRWNERRHQRSLLEFVNRGD